MQTNKTARQYLDAISQSMRDNFYTQDFYSNREGCLRLGRDFGYGLADFPEDQRREVRGALYGNLVVLHHILRNREVPIDNREFLAAIDEGIAKSKAYVSPV